MHEIRRPQGSLTTLVSEVVGDGAEVALCRDQTPSVVWVRINSKGHAPRLYCVSGAMKTLAVGEHFAAAGVIDPPGAVRSVELELLGQRQRRYIARICPEGWLLILPPATGEYRQRVTFHYQTGESVESATLPPAAHALDSGGTTYAPL